PPRPFSAARPTREPPRPPGAAPMVGGPPPVGGAPATWGILRLLDVAPHSPRYCTSAMMLASLAPGVSCFPFVASALGDEALARVAVADLGNKLFVLVVLYLVALRLLSIGGTAVWRLLTPGRLWALGRKFVVEPINGFVLIAVALQALGLGYAAVPAVGRHLLETMAQLLLPLAMIFIGLCLRLKSGDGLVILWILLLRAGVAFLISAALLAAVPLDPLSALVTVALLQSACSFWPLTHIDFIQGKMAQASADANNRNTQTTNFDHDHAMGLLAISMPFSSAIVVAVLLHKDAIVHPPIQAVLGSSLLLVAALLSVGWQRRTLLAP
ncbi:MAG: hypothetical protein ACFCBW_17840, partial [Candidatus Competibacterales bacterium]